MESHTEAKISPFLDGLTAGTTRNVLTRTKNKKIENRPDNIGILKHLKWLYVRNCCCLGKLPVDIVQLESLERLVLSATMIKDLPCSICMLKHLKLLKLDDCALLEKLPEDIGLLECLEELDITHIGTSHLPQSIFRLKCLLITAPPELLQFCNFPSEIETRTWYQPPL
ncbi:NB-ARC domains-containing protein [Artemisia annua]|uniref:NB-ARC domains-containing protein n=1 Tax=Artemisia annua TaxID=35608 RepID=A0A2U1QHE6_ARTAN|nr:NB-ARC domains-containing protein [Artemisia annua]